MIFKISLFMLQSFMKILKKEIDELTKNYRINRTYLRKLIKMYYPKGSRMDYYITNENVLKPIGTEVRAILYREHGIPHLIFDDLLKYMSNEVEKEAFIVE